MTVYFNAVYLIFTYCKCKQKFSCNIVKISFLEFEAEVARALKKLV
jgi:hypothetical protein